MGIITGKFMAVAAERFLDLNYLYKNVKSLQDFGETVADGRSVAEVIWETWKMDYDNHTARNAYTYYGWIWQEDTRLGMLAQKPLAP